MSEISGNACILCLQVMSGSSGYSWNSDYSPLYNYISTSAINPADKFEYYAVINYNQVILLRNKINCYYFYQILI